MITLWFSVGLYIGGLVTTTIILGLTLTEDQSSGLVKNWKHRRWIYYMFRNCYYNVRPMGRVMTILCYPVTLAYAVWKIQKEDPQAAQNIDSYIAGETTLWWEEQLK